jgi:hypothetical protein
MEIEVVDFLHQSIKIAVRLVVHPREHVVDRLFKAVFELCSKRRGFRDEFLKLGPYNFNRACHTKNLMVGISESTPLFESRIPVQSRDPLGEYRYAAGV